MKGQIRSICMVGAFLVGGLFHSFFSLLQPYLPFGIALMLSISFIGLDIRKMKPCLMHFWVLIAIQVSGLGFWWLASLIHQPILAEALYYCGAAPIAAASPVIVHLIRGNVEFITTAMVLSQIVFGFATPFVLPLVLHAPQLSYLDLVGLVAEQMGLVLLLPAALAFLLRVIYPKSKEWAPKWRDFSLFIWIFNLTIIAATGTKRILEIHCSWADMWPMALGAAVVCLTGFVAGYYLGYPKLKRECSQALGQKNTILTLYIASLGYGSPLAYIGPVFYVFYHNVANAVQMFLAERERQREEAALQQQAAPLSK